MLRVFSLVDGILGSRSLEIHWHGIVNGPFLFRRPITFDLGDLRQLVLWFLLDIEFRFSYIWFASKRVPIKRYELT
jgi:hypothetical protein